MLFSGVSDLAEKVSAIKCTQLCHCSVGSDTPQDFCGFWRDLVLRGLISLRILFCGISDPAGRLRLRGTRRKSFESLPFFLKGHFSKIICMHKLHNPRHLEFMLKEPLYEKCFFVPRVLIPCRTTLKFEYLCRTTLKFEYLR
jgi:hypothetical protein